MLAQRAYQGQDEWEGTAQLGHFQAMHTQTRNILNAT